MSGDYHEPQEVSGVCKEARSLDVLIDEARLRATTIRSDVRQYTRDSDAFVSLEVLRRWHLDYLLDTADKLVALCDALEAERG